MAKMVVPGRSENSEIQGSLFEGKRFWLSQKVPQRSSFVERVQANGGEVVQLEKRADIKIVDHMRKETLPGTYSYTYIESSIRNGVLEELEDHAVGPQAGTVRSVGSTLQPVRKKRTPFTAEDERVLYRWVDTYRQKGGATDGNEIYKQLEVENGRHTWQSWRDHWIKCLKDRAPPALMPHNAPPTPPSEQPAVDKNLQPSKPEKSPRNVGDNAETFTEVDAQALLDVAEDLLNVHPDNSEAAWQKWAHDHSKFPGQSAQKWQDFWEKSILPVYLERKAIERGEEKEVDMGSILSIPSKDHAIVEPRSCEEEAAAILTTLTTDHVKPGTDRQKSPSYHPESPRLTITPLKVTHTAVDTKHNVEILEDVPEPDKSEVQSASPPFGKAFIDGNASPKRKRTTFEDELPHSSPLTSITPIRNKRQRQESVQRELLEIPSTPDKSPRPNPALSPILPTAFLDRQVIDLEDEFSEQGDEDEEEEGSPIGFQGSQSLSEPDHLARATQAAFKEQTPFIEFDIPPPPNGWDDEDPITEEPESEEASTPPGFQDIVMQRKPSTSQHEQVATEAAHEPDTQTLLASKTQLPDFTLPSPTGGWSSPPPSSPPSLSQSSQTAIPDPTFSPPTSPSAITAALDAWIDAHAARDHPTAHVELALRCTGMDTELAEEVLVHLGRYGVLPVGRRGVWTEEEDEVLLGSTDARRIRRLEIRHGGEGVDRRIGFLRVYRGVG